MISRILLAVDDSPGGLAAARLAIELASRLPAALVAVEVHGDGVVAEALPPREAVSDPAHSPLLSHVAAMADRAGVTYNQCRVNGVDGEVAESILGQAKAHAADLIVLGRSRQPGYGQPYIGSQTRIVLEFATTPVLAVPAS